MTLKERIESNFIPEPNSGCWLWLGYVTKKGYGRIGFQNKTYEVYRLYYELVRPKIPDGLVLDHKCRLQSCINPDHLEVVTRVENVMRGTGYYAQHARRTKCPTCGNQYSFRFFRTSTGEKRQRRFCRICTNASWMRSYYKRKSVNTIGG